ncbi:hydroxyisourate hydrolase [Granulicella sp. WH15]|uniref:hydroxyisourate hydrolase n=1 Tax=Granulicella sp. WH15 TaxID=2602070 RepID=UPI001366D18D|nr:hydroxyisourate hydrolase [Granulicella sp. WH15]QHN02112.1 hydroxyisourate hydrolase [Granulicella sp. WH15]
MTKKLAFKAFLLSFYLCIASKLPAQSKNLSIQILDAKTGKPIANNHVLLFFGTTTDDLRSLGQHAELTTNKDGLAPLPETAKTSTLLQVSVDWHQLCGTDFASRTIELESIVNQGVSVNHCTIRTFQTTPGRLVIAVRPETLMEKMRH